MLSDPVTGAGVGMRERLSSSNFNCIFMLSLSCYIFLSDMSTLLMKFSAYLLQSDMATSADAGRRCRSSSPRFAQRYLGRGSREGVTPVGRKVGNRKKELKGRSVNPLSGCSAFRKLGYPHPIEQVT